MPTEHDLDVMAEVISDAVSSMNEGEPLTFDQWRYVAGKVVEYQKEEAQSDLYPGKVMYDLKDGE
jgi:hypothetical protein